jgi:DNA ligase-associated metallophosphoesterase
MQAPVQHKINGYNFWLSASRTVFWEEEKALIISDLHFGKTGHFRKAGIAIPQTVYKEDLQRLLHVVQFYKPSKIIAVGDLFHSHANLELELFRRWRDDLPHLAFHLVKGNHDILKERWYSSAGIQLWDNDMVLRDVRFCHENCAFGDNHYLFCGHIHPGVVVSGIGKQSLRFPCFYFTENHCILPAYSRFSGMATIEPSATDSVYAIVDNSLIRLQ